MVPQGIEVRADLQTRSDVLAFGFHGEHIAAHSAARLLGTDLLNYICSVVENAPAGFVVVDLRNVEPLSTAAIGQLLSFNKQLSQYRCRLALLVSDPVLREVLSATNLDHLFTVAADESELRALVERSSPVDARPVHDDSPDFSESELAELESEGLTLDDAIHAIEQSRR